MRSVTLVLLGLLLVAPRGATAETAGSVGLIAYERSLRGGPQTEIWVMNADGSGQRKLADGREFAWAPDGRVIAFVHSDALYTIGVDGTGLRRIADARYGGDPDWSPDGRRIAVGSSLGIAVITRDGRSTTRLTKEPDFAPHWSPDGRRIVFERLLEHGSDIFVMNADGSNVRRLTRDRANYAAWSPGGRRIAFLHGAMRGDDWDSWDADIYVMDADGSNQRQITNTPHVIEAAPRWSLTGARILFMSGSGSRREVHTITPEGKRHRRLTRGRFPQWSGDGRSIVFNKAVGNNSDIYVMTAAGRDATNLTNTPRPAQESRAAFSPSP